MKTKRWAVLALIAYSLLLLAHDVFAFYNPQTGRWLNRDPIGEPPFSAITRNEIKQSWLELGYAHFGESEPNPFSAPANLYEFVENAPSELTDYLGLMTEPGFRDWQKCSPPRKWAKKVFGAEVPKADGCSVPSSLVPEGGTKDDPTGKCSFEQPCNNHDYCYSNCKRTRTICDERWGREMKKACDTCAANMARDFRVVKQFLRDCYAWANRYKWAVEKFGENAYETRQKKNCECVCAAR